MNLWVRTLRQLTLLSVALFFFSCEDESSILGFRNPNKKFQVGYLDIPLSESQVLSLDSMVTDLRPLFVNGQTQLVDGLLVGQYTDADLGKVSAKTFLKVNPTVTSALSSSAVYDSVTVQFRLNFYSYGFAGLGEKRVAVHEITGDTLTLYNGNRYYAHSGGPAYSAEPLGEARISVQYDSLQKQAALTASRQDTLMLAGRLSDEFGQRLFDAVKGGVTVNGFRSQIKGFALVPTETEGVLGFNVINSFGQLSRVLLHYHTLDANGAVDDTLSRTYSFDYASFTQVQADRAGTELDGIQPYQSIQPASGLRYVQSGAAITTKVDLSPFYAFADTAENILINSAEFVIGNVTAPEGQRPPASLMFRLMNGTSDLFLDSRKSGDSTLAAGIDYILRSDAYYTPATDGSSGVMLSYDPDDDEYSGFMTLFVQGLFANKGDGDGINENRLRYLSLFPVSPPAARSVSRAVFHKDNVKLRIYYTRPNTVTP